MGNVCRSAVASEQVGGSAAGVESGWLERGVEMLADRGVFAKEPKVRIEMFKLLRRSQDFEFMEARERLELLMRTRTDREPDEVTMSDLHLYGTHRNSRTSSSR